MTTVERLLSTLDRQVVLLQEAGEVAWGDRLARAASEIRAGDFHGIERLLRCYGGMGSFGDLWLAPGNGHTIEPSRVESVNRQLDSLRGETYRLACELKRNSPGAGR